MSGPRRLLEGEGTILERELLLSARWEQPRADGVERALTAVGLSAAAISTAACLAAGASSAATSATSSVTMASVAKGTLAALAMKWAAIGAVGGVLMASATEGRRLVSDDVPGTSLLGSHVANPTRSNSRSARRGDLVPTLGATPLPGVAAPETGHSSPEVPADSSADVETTAARTGSISSARPTTGSRYSMVPSPNPGLPSTSDTPVGLIPQPEPPADPSSSGQSVVAPANGLSSPGAHSARAQLADAVASSPVAPRVLSPEVAWMDRVHAELSQHHVREALALLDQFARDFPNGRLAPEADLLRVRALLESGDKASARRLADRLLRRDPDGPYARQIQSLVGR